MMQRRTSTQTSHDAAVKAEANIYREKGKHVWIDPGSEKNELRAGKFIDMITVDNPRSDRAW